MTEVVTKARRNSLLINILEIRLAKQVTIVEYDKPKVTMYQSQIK